MEEKGSLRGLTPRVVVVQHRLVFHCVLHSVVVLLVHLTPSPPFPCEGLSGGGRRRRCRRRG